MARCRGASLSGRSAAPDTNDSVARRSRRGRYPRLDAGRVTMPRITGGALGSRKLRSPKGMHVRPTPGRVKESLFSILQHRIEGSRFLDLYSGTGAIAFEAASRGAASVVAVEMHRETAQAAEE